MEKKSFSIRECAFYGWQTTFSNIGLSVVIWLTIFGVQVAFTFMAEGITWLAQLAREQMKGMGIAGLVEKTDFIANIIFYIFTWFIAFGMILGLIRIALDLYDKGTSNITRLFSGFRVVPKIWLVLLVLILWPIIHYWKLIDTMLMIRSWPRAIRITSLAIVVVTILFILSRISFFICRMVDKNAGLIESVLYSFGVTQGLFWKVLGLSIVAGLSSITVIGIPAAFYMLTAAYRKLPTPNVIALF